MYKCEIICKDDDLVIIVKIKDEVDDIYNIEDNKWRIRIKNTMMKS